MNFRSGTRTGVAQPQLKPQTNRPRTDRLTASPKPTAPRGSRSVAIYGEKSSSFGVPTMLCHVIASCSPGAPNPHKVQTAPSACNSSLPTQTGPAQPREDTTRTKAGVRVAAARARHAGAGPHAGRGRVAACLAGRRVGGGARGRAEGARAASVELSSILGGLTARTRGTPTHLRQSLPPPLPASRLEGGSTSAGIGARRALGIVDAIRGRRGMVGGTARLSTTSLSTIKPLPIPVIIICEWEREEWLSRTTWKGRAARAAARCGRRGDARQAEGGAVARGNLGSNSWRGTYKFSTNLGHQNPPNHIERHDREGDAKENQPRWPHRR